MSDLSTRDQSFSFCRKSNDNKANTLPLELLVKSHSKLVSLHFATSFLTIPSASLSISQSPSLLIFPSTTHPDAARSPYSAKCIERLLSSGIILDRLLLFCSCLFRTFQCPKMDY